MYVCVSVCVHDEGIFVLEYPPEIQCSTAAVSLDGHCLGKDGNVLF